MGPASEVKCVILHEGCRRGAHRMSRSRVLVKGHVMTLCRVVVLAVVVLLLGIMVRLNVTRLLLEGYS